MGLKKNEDDKKAEKVEKLPKDLRKEEGFLNDRMRKWNVSAYLRCLYASIEYAPTYDLRQSAISRIEDSRVFGFVTELCDACGWDEEACIGAKYLRVMRNVLEIPLENEYEEDENLNMYEMISYVT